MQETTTPRADLVTDLAALPTGAQGVIRALDGGHGFVSRLATLGFTTGVVVKMVQNYGSGPIIAMVRGTRVALGRGEAAHIQVSAEVKR